MLAEKFLLFLEHLIRHEINTDQGPRVVSTSRHVPIDEMPTLNPGAAGCLVPGEIDIIGS
ncbi:hypothetical protein [Bradyrhizobium sp. Tv2a-2]|uniref:hypothetical protein n=1 Tax=Bradyrhizobium sp. Tv2a-2 TaxID=113395 RepID=UPI000418CA3C|nr:hypothetical protein [Bradyrhizobium sp. Tv2a-2]